MGNECCETGKRPIQGPSKTFIYGYNFQKDSVQSIQPILKTSNFVTMTPPNEYIDRQQCQQPHIDPSVKSKMSTSLSLDVGATQSSRGVLQNVFYKFKRSGNVYRGEWKDNMPHGLGTLYIQKGNVYQGLFYQGVPFGRGKLIMTSGAVYEGEVKYGKANGEGTYTEGQFTYRGQFKDDLKDGQGQQREGDYYFKGMFQKGEKVRGVYKYENNIYEGEFQNDEFHGKGELKNSDSSIYKGSFKHGRFHGYGQFKWADGSLYRGNYIDGQREGDGQFFNIKNSSISRGIWSGGILNGEGEYKDYRGKITKCVWSNGKMTGIKTK